jgi:putative membrane protein
MQPERATSGDPRVFLAIERTFLAWTRTALALMGFGFVVARLGLFLREIAGGAAGVPAGGFRGSVTSSLWLGTSLVVLGVAVQSLALLEYLRLKRQFESGTSVVPLRRSLAQLLGLVLIGFGLVVTAYLAGLL